MCNEILCAMLLLYSACVSLKPRIVWLFYTQYFIASAQHCTLKPLSRHNKCFKGNAVFTMPTLALIIILTLRYICTFTCTFCFFLMIMRDVFILPLSIVLNNDINFKNLFLGAKLIKMYFQKFESNNIHLLLMFLLWTINNSRIV